MSESSVLDAVKTGLFIGGEWRDAAETLDVEDPSTGETIAQVADATPEDAAAIASSKGSDIAMPAPRRKLRRERARLVDAKGPLPARAECGFFMRVAVRLLVEE